MDDINRIVAAFMARALLVSIVTFGLLASGCIDPKAGFEEFAKRTELRESGTTDAPSTLDGAGCTVMPGIAEGTYLLALSTPIAPDTPLLYETKVTTPPLNSGTGIVFDSQPLSAADRRTPVGTPFSAGPSPVDETGAFRLDFGTLTTTGAANPISGSQIVATVTVVGNLCGGATGICGSVEGMVSDPLQIDLHGATFAMTLAGPGGTYREPPPINCSGDLAVPL